MVSPRYHGKKCDAQWPVSPEVHAKHFDYILAEMNGLIDAYAFMDGHVDFKDLESYVKATYEVFQKHEVAYWSNLETFDRDMSWRFPPIEWIKMKHKLEVVQPYVEKIITFEAPHFLSPNSALPAAHGLFQPAGAMRPICNLSQHILVLIFIINLVCKHATKSDNPNITKTRSQ